jgi:hypothetical protein
LISCHLSWGAQVHVDTDICLLPYKSRHSSLMFLLEWKQRWDHDGRLFLVEFNIVLTRNWSSSNCLSSNSSLVSFTKVVAYLSLSMSSSLDFIFVWALGGFGWINLPLLNHGLEWVMISRRSHVFTEISTTTDVWWPSLEKNAPVFDVNLTFWTLSALDLTLHSLFQRHCWDWSCSAGGKQFKTGNPL